MGGSILRFRLRTTMSGADVGCLEGNRLGCQMLFGLVNSQPFEVGQYNRFAVAGGHIDDHRIVDDLIGGWILRKGMIYWIDAGQLIELGADLAGLRLRHDRFLRGIDAERCAW